MIDCHDREIVGFEFALRGRAREAERALEQACLQRFGTLRPAEQTPVICSDNGLVFQSRRFREACRFYRLKQEYITPYTPEQNGLVERFFRGLKEECVAAQLRELPASKREGGKLDQLVQPGEATSGSRLSEPCAIQKTKAAGGLISVGE